VIEFFNPAGHEISLPGQDGTPIKFVKFEKKLLPGWYKRYVPRYLRVIKVIADDQRRPRVQTIPIGQNRRPVQNVPQPNIQKPTRMKVRLPTAQVPQRTPVSRRNVVGRVSQQSESATTYLREFVSKTTIPISNDIGVGILSYNRQGSLQRLVDSIRRTTNLAKTTVFISDESTDQATKQYVRGIKDMVVLDNSERLGIAGNTNRLMRCLERFRYKIILNDDVEMLQKGWESIYVMAIQKGNFHHFCMRQPGVYGAGEDGAVSETNGVKIWTVKEKPHGAVLVYDHECFAKVGFFDESFGLYGMEHVDWSNRVALSGIQPPGYHDVLGSANFIKIHKEPSAVESRSARLSEARRKFDELTQNKSRVYVNASEKSVVPKVSFIIPFRGLERTGAIGVVLQNIKGQHFPAIEIVMVEQDNSTKTSIPEFETIKYVLARGEKDFCKAQAFNQGVASTTCNKLILHDADMIVQADYASQMSKLLDEYEAVHIGKTVVYLDLASTTRLVNEKQMNNQLSAERSVGYFEGGSLGCTFNTYVRCGGFYEEFVGYGCEDCEFYDRLIRTSKSFTTRSLDLVHLWHGRASQWHQRHEQNKDLDRKLRIMLLQNRVNLVALGLKKYNYKSR